MRGELAPQIAELTELVTTTAADALTVESRVANAENAIRLALAEAELAELDAQDTQYNADITRFQVFADMGDPEAASNIERIRARMTENDSFRAEARAKIADVEESQS